MDNSEQLTLDNWIAYAVRHYINPGCTSKDEFLDDLNRIVYIKKLLRKYQNGTEFELRLLLNHIVVFYNVFPVEVATRLLFLKIESSLWDVLVPILEFFGFMPDTVPSINGNDILSINIDKNIVIIQELAEL